MDQVEHLHPAVVVELAVEDLAPGGADQGDVRRVVHVVVDRLESPVPEVVEHRRDTPFHLAEEDGVGVAGHFFGMEHGGDAAEDHGQAARAEFPGDLKSPRQLTGEHDRYRHQVGGCFEVDRLEVFVGEVDLDLRRQGRGEDHRPVGRQVELGLTVEFGPTGVDQFQLHGNPLLGDRGPPQSRRTAATSSCQVVTGVPSMIGYSSSSSSGAAA